MSENRFADCATVEHVLRSLLPIEPPEVWDALEADALARIRELTPPAVSEEARERAIRALRLRYDDRQGDWVHAPYEAVVDRVIAALGYTPAPPKLICTCGEFETIVCEEHPAPASPPVVELTPAELRKCADIVARIAAVMRLHQWRATVRTSYDDPVLDCSCGIAFGGGLDCQRDVFDCHREHVADAVIRELKLEAEDGECGYCRAQLPGCRYVTEWENDE